MGSPYVWDESYKAALIGSDGQKRRKCLYAAKVAIDNRLHELQFADGGTQEERQAISDALSSLNLIRKESEKPRPAL